jgi:1-acyl-sn-glycerol-3-phosphate acyltransferase
MTTVKRTISFLAAKVSMEKPIVGHLMKAADCVPVKRHQDQKLEKGTGKLEKLKGNSLLGKNTKFTKMNEGATIYFDERSKLKVK